jgi:hypothetical protein
MATAILRAVLACAAAAAFTVGCSGGGNDSGTGTLNVGITDAPVDFASSVVVTFTGVELKPHGGEAFSIDFAEDKTLDLLTLQGINRATILDGETVPAGDYEWMRLKVVCRSDVAGDSVHPARGRRCARELRVPSGAETGLKMIRGFTVGVGATTDLTVDFDVRKSIVEPPGQRGADPLVCDGQAYLLKPVLRVIDNLQVGTISGAVDPALIAASCPEDLSAPYPGGVYLFGPVPSATTVTPDDYDGIAEDPNGDDALTSALVDPNTFQYTIGFVPAGDYVVAYTCDTDSGDVDANAPDDPAGADEVVEFTPAAGTAVTVSTDATSVVNFDAPTP